MTDRTRAPCLQEQWFIEDEMANIEGLCPMCRRDFETKLQRFGPDNRSALSEIYRLSRSIRVEAVMSGKLDEAREMGNYEILKVMDTIEHMILIGLHVFNRQLAERGVLR